MGKIQIFLPQLLCFVPKRENIQKHLTLRARVWYLTAFLVSTLAWPTYSTALLTFFSMLSIISPCTPLNNK